MSCSGLHDHNSRAHDVTCSRSRGLHTPSITNPTFTPFQGGSQVDHWISIALSASISGGSVLSVHSLSVLPWLRFQQNLTSILCSLRFDPKSSAPRPSPPSPSSVRGAQQPRDGAVGTPRLTSLRGYDQDTSEGRSWKMSLQVQAGSTWIGNGCVGTCFCISGSPTPRWLGFS